MIFIAHGGNINGVNRDRENHPDYVIESISKGYDVEVDVYLHNSRFFLGHDKPQYDVESYFFEELSSKLWCHAKNATALRRLVDMGMHCFFHDSDAVVLTSKNYLWTFPGKELVKGSVAVLPEMHKDDTIICAGICSNLIEQYKKRGAKT